MAKELQFVDEGKVTQNIPLQMKHCGATKTPWPINPIFQT